MGLNDPKVYLDSSLAIYLVEESPVFRPKVEAVIERLPQVAFCISPLTVMECLILPTRLDDKPLIQKFSKWFSEAELLTIGTAVFQRATQLRADFPRLKTPDALHIATALHHNCDEFWTNDGRLDNIAPKLVKNIL